MITPSYMQGEYLEQTIRSVLLQGYPNLEYMVLDGGSTDASRSIIEHYAPWLTHWRCEKDSGQAASILEGWQRGTGELFAWINSDDWYQAGALYAVAEAALKTPEQAWWMGPVDDCDVDGVFLKRHLPSEADLARVLGRKNQGWHQPGMFWRKRLIEKIGPLDATLHYSFDHDFWARSLAEGFPMTPLETPIACFRRHPASKTGGNPARTLLEDELIFRRHAGKLSAEARRQAEQWRQEFEADLLIPAVYRLLMAKRRGAAFNLLVRYAHLIPRLDPPRAWFGAALRVILGRPAPAWMYAG